jgi:hypothetical protein
MAIIFRNTSSNVETISLTLTPDDPNEGKVSRCWSFFHYPVQKVGELLRNAFYLPLYNKKIDSAVLLDQSLAEDISSSLMKRERPEDGPPCAIAMWRYFSVRDVSVQIKDQDASRLFRVRLFESKMGLSGKKLRIFLFSFYGNTEKLPLENQSRRWEPQTMKELSTSPLFVLKALKERGIRVDSLVTTSLGNVALDGLKYNSSKDSGEIPPILIINRGLTSVQKVATQLYFFPLNYVLYGAAKLSGWNANPEKELLNFLEKRQQNSRKSQHKVILIEAQNDFYFSGNGGFQADTHEKIKRLKVPLFRASFHPFPVHTRAHHAISLDHLNNNSATQVTANTFPFPLEKWEKMSSAIARNIFFAGDLEYHTVFIIAGNEANLDVGTAREALPLLSAFVEEGQKLAEKEVKESA